MSMSMNNKSNSRTLFSGSAEDRSDAIDWELRPRGMLVQRRDDGDAAAGPMIKVKVSHGSYQREVSIPAQATFGDLKKLLSQCQRHAKVILLEDPANKEKKLEEMKRNQSITKACQAIAAVKGEVVKLSVQARDVLLLLLQVSAIEAAVNGGTKVADNNFIVVTEMLMIELLKLDNIEAEEEVKVHRRVEDMLLGGSDTAPRIIEWAISEVLKNPAVLRKLQQELEQVVGFGRMVCESDLPRLVYLQAVVKETLRLYPQGPFLFRHLYGEACNVLGYEIPQNTGVIVNVWAIGRNPKSWKNAECFQPERFMEEIGSGVDARGDQNLDWLPFGAGRRRCPGQQLGTLVAEFGVAQLLHCFNWRLPLDDITGKEQELDMTERFDGIMFPRADELFAIPTPRLECFAHLK